MAFWVSRDSVCISYCQNIDWLKGIWKPKFLFDNIRLKIAYPYRT